MIERAWPAVYHDDPTSQARRHSWRWFLNRVVGLVERDQLAAKQLLSATGHQPGGPAAFEAWLRMHSKPAAKPGG